MHHLIGADWYIAHRAIASGPVNVQLLMPGNETFRGVRIGHQTSSSLRVRGFHRQTDAAQPFVTRS